MVTQSAPWGGLLACLYIASGGPSSILLTALTLSLNSKRHSEHTLIYNGLGLNFGGDFRPVSLSAVNKV